MKTLSCWLTVLLAATLTAPAQEGKVVLDFPNTPVADVLRFYGTLTGEQVIFDNTVQGQISLRSNGPVGHDQAVKLIEDTLFLNGFSLVDSEDGTTLKVLGLGRSVRAEGVPIYTDLAALPKHERIVSFVLRINRIDPLEVTGFLQQYVPPGSTTAFTPSSPGGLLVITARTGMIRPLVKLAEAMDSPRGDEPPKRAEAPPARPEPPKPAKPATDDDDD